jgi:putative SOS response-associated peptidase YedK
VERPGRNGHRILHDPHQGSQPVAQGHSRQKPVIIAKDDYDLWLDPGVTDPAKVADLMKPFDSRLMRLYPVNSTVGNVKNDGPECAKETVIEGEDSAAQDKLF